MFSKNYIAKSKKVDKILNLLEEYLNKYKNKIKKSFDSQCILMYEIFEDVYEDLKEKKELYITKNINYNLKSYEKDMEEIMYVLNNLYFDSMTDSKELFYYKMPNDKLPKKVNCKILNKLETHKGVWINYDKQKRLNDEFIKKYFDKTGIDLNKDKEQKSLIFEIHTYIKDINNAIVDFLIYKDVKKLEIHIEIANHFMNQDFNCLKDIYYKNLIKRIDKIIRLICEAKSNKAYEEIQIIIKENEDLYERIS